MSFFKECKNSFFKVISLLVITLLVGIPAFAGEADLIVPNFEGREFDLLLIGIIVSALGLVWGLIAYGQIKSVKAHKAMTAIGSTIFELVKHILFNKVSFYLC